MEMNYCPSGDLSHCLRPNRICNYLEKEIKYIGTQLLIGLKILHSKNIIHCNLKPSNILIDELGNAKICDLKKSIKIGEYTKEEIYLNKTAMTPCYTAPELFEIDNEYTFKSDLWALGCILYEMAVGQVPFYDTEMNKLIVKIIEKDVNFDKKQLNKYSNEFIEILQKLLNKDQEKRAGWGYIEKLPFWNNNEKGFYDAFPDLNKDSDTSIFFENTNESDITNSLKHIEIKKNIFQNSINIFNINNSWNKDRRNKLNSFTDLSNFKKNKTKSLGFDIKNKLNTPKKQISENDSDYNNYDLELNINNEEEQYSDIKFKELQKSQNENELSLSEGTKHKKNNKLNTMALSLENSYELIKIENLMIHNSDKIIRPIINNKIIEPNEKLITYDENKIRLKKIYKKEQLKELLKNEKEFSKYMNEIYTQINKEKNQNELLLNILIYLESIIKNKDICNNIINTPLLQLLIEFLNITDDQIKICICNIIANLIRYSTNLEKNLDEYNLTEILTSFISDSNIILSRKAIATLGEYLFFLFVQAEIEFYKNKRKKIKNKKWKISSELIQTFLFALNHLDEKVRFYSLKTIENICILTTIAKDYFANNENFLDKIIEIINSDFDNPEIQTCGLNTISYIIKLNPLLMNYFLDKIDDINIMLENENQKNQQCIINCILFGINGDKKNIKYIQKNKLIKVLIKFLENSNNIIKGKSILLISLIFNEINLAINFGDNLLKWINKLQKNKKNFYYHVKIFEKSFTKFCDELMQNYKNYLKDNNNKNIQNKLLPILKCFNNFAKYSMGANNIFNSFFLNSSITFLNNYDLNSEIAKIILDLMKIFSENSQSIEDNCDLIIEKIFKSILLLTKKLINNEYRRIPLNICGNIISIILENESIYSSKNINFAKTKLINNLIKEILPIIYELLINKKTVYDSLSFLSLIIENNIFFINNYRQIGIIDYILVLIKEKEFYTNLNLIKIIAKLVEYDETTLNDIINLDIIEIINYLIEKDNFDEITIYTEYIIEILFNILLKINQYKINKKENEKIEKNIIKTSNNFNICIKLLSIENLFLQEKVCSCLFFIIQFFPKIKFKDEDIPYLIHCLENGNEKIYNKIIIILKWIIEHQKDSKNLFKDYGTYIQICIEKIINISNDKSDINEIAKEFLKRCLPNII